MPELTYQANPDKGIVSFYVDGQHITDWAYENDPEDSFNEFKLVFSTGFNARNDLSTSECKIKLEAINHFADIWIGAAESGFVEATEEEAKDIERMIRQHGHDNYHPDGYKAKLSTDCFLGSE